MLDGFLLCWYILTGLSLIYLVYDQVTNTPSMPIMGLAWFLVLLYTGPIGLFFYFISCRQPLPDTHDQFISAHWKQALGSEIHCVAGDATAIIITAALLHYFALPNGIETIIEYVAAYLFGLFVFQALFMLGMFKNYWEAVRKTIFAETVSMNTVMTGMLPVIFIIRELYAPARDPLRPYFWGMMSLATLAGFVVGYPINSWMVRKGLKHGMMSRGMSHHHHEAGTISAGKMWFHIAWTYALLIIVFLIISIWIPVRFS